MSQFKEIEKSFYKSIEIPNNDPIEKMIQITAGLNLLVGGGITLEQAQTFYDGTMHILDLDEDKYKNDPNYVGLKYKL